MPIAMLVGALATKALLSVRDGFGGMFGTEPPSLVSIGIGVIVGGGLCALGIGAGKANDAKDLARRVLMVVVALLACYVAIEIVFALNVMACRMILGAHFLSDVSVGALMGVIAFLILLALQERQPRRP